MGYQQFIPLNVRKWTPNSYLKCQNFIPDAKSVISKRPWGVGGYHPPLVARRLNLHRSSVTSLDLALCSIFHLHSSVYLFKWQYPMIAQYSTSHHSLFNNPLKSIHTLQPSLKVLCYLFDDTIFWEWVCGQCSLKFLKSVCAENFFCARFYQD